MFVIINLICPTYRIGISSSLHSIYPAVRNSKEDSLCPRWPIPPSIHTLDPEHGFWPTEHGKSDALWLLKLSGKESYSFLLVSGCCHAVRTPGHRERIGVGTHWQVHLSSQVTARSTAHCGSEPSWMSSSVKPPDDSSTKQLDRPPPTHTPNPGLCPVHLQDHARW